MSLPSNTRSRAPLKLARVFLSHAWQDNSLSDALAAELAARYSLLYDRSTLVEIGTPILPREAIVRADFFIFLASAASVASRSMAFEEFRLADASRLRRERRIALVALGDFEVPEDYADTRFERLAEPTVTADCQRICTSLDRRLVELGGLRPTPGGLVGGGDVEPIIEFLKEPMRRSGYPFNAVFQKPELDKVIREIQQMPSTDLEEIAGNLLDIYLAGRSDGDQFVLRHNAVYLLSRLKAGSVGIAEQLRASYPGGAETILYRGFHVALGFLGDLDTMTAYVEQLSRRPGPQWDASREFNLMFHIMYYGSVEGALTDLREEIRQIQPINLLGLDVLTLGGLSGETSDLELLESQHDKLVQAGVDRALVDDALVQIRKRV